MTSLSANYLSADQIVSNRAANGAQFKWQTWDDLLPTIQDEDLIDGWISAYFTILFGDPFVRKSMLVAHWIKALLMNEPFLDALPRATGSGHRIMIITTDGGANKQLRKRLERLGMPGQVARERLLVLDQVRFSTETINPLLADVRAFGATLVVIDTLQGASPVGTDISSSKEMGLPLDCIKKLSQVCAVVALHHSAKSHIEGRARTPAGSVSILGDARLAIHLEGNPKEDYRKVELLPNDAEPRTVAINITKDFIELTELRKKQRDGSESKQKRKTTDHAILSAIAIYNNRATIATKTDSANLVAVKGIGRKAETPSIVRRLNRSVFHQQKVGARLLVFEDGGISTGVDWEKYVQPVIDTMGQTDPSP